MIKIATKEFNKLVAEKIAEKKLNAADGWDVHCAEIMVADDLNNFSEQARACAAVSMIEFKGARIVKIGWYYSESKWQQIYG